MSTATAPLAWFVPNIVRSAWAEATVIALAVVFGLVRIVTGVPRVSRKDLLKLIRCEILFEHMQV